MNQNFMKIAIIGMIFCNKTFAENISEKKVCKYGITFIKINDGILKVNKDKNTYNYPVSSFWMSESEISYRQYASVMGADANIIKLNVVNDSQLDFPVGNISYFECISFTDALSKRLLINDGTNDYFTSGSCSLPTEMQWEFVASQSYSNPTVSKELINEYSRLSGENLFVYRLDQLAKVKHSKPNIMGIHDIIGNSYEICREPYQTNYDYKNPERNMSVQDIRNFKISVRGGLAFFLESYHPAYRSAQPILFKDPCLGFRLVWEEKLK